MLTRLREVAAREQGYFGIGLAIVLETRNYVLYLTVFSIVISSLYVVLLPSLPLGSINLQTVQFITPLQVIFAVVFGALLSFVITLNIYAIRSNLRGTQTVTIGSILASLVNGLCCTPLIPSLLALFSTSPAFLFAYAPATQAFFERNYPYFYFLSAALLLISVQRLSKGIAYCRVPGK